MGISGVHHRHHAHIDQSSIAAAVNNGLPTRVLPAVGNANTAAVSSTSSSQKNASSSSSSAASSQAVIASSATQANAISVNGVDKKA